MLVRSGISGEIDLDTVPARRRPDAVIDGVADLLDRLGRAALGDGWLAPISATPSSRPGR